MNIFEDELSSEHRKNILEKQKQELENHLYIIKLDNNIDPFRNEMKLQSLYTVDDDLLFRKINIISMMMDQTSVVFNIVKGVSFNITQVDQIRLSHTKYIDRIIFNTLDNGKLYCFGIKNNDFYIICKDMMEVNKIKYKLILVDDPCYIYLTLPPSGVKPKIKIINITFPMDNDIDYDLEQVTEGLFINKDGDIKITINPKKSYMNEYMECHRILVENYKNKNYEAMKQNVAFMFLLISIIERDPKYKEREKDIVKARAFAINDFKTYLGYIMKEEPTFNFEKYYMESELDKYVFNIPKETILGIKSLLKSILM